MSTPTRRLLAATTALVMLLGAAASPAVAANPNLPDRIDLPNGWLPEGIESQGHWLYSGSRANGAVYRADARTGDGAILVPGEAGNIAVGLHVDDQGRLWVAGGPSAEVNVYDIKSGERLAVYTFPGTGFLNDLDIVDGNVYVTDSPTANLGVIPLGADGSLPDPSEAFLLPLGGEWQQVAGFNANGIVATGSGWLIVVNSTTGLLYRVDPSSGEATEIDTGGVSVGAGDGMELRGSRLYVVRNALADIEVFRLSEDLLSADHLGTIESPDEGDFPTTATLSMGALWVVNARFATPPTPDTPYWIRRLPTRP